MFTCMRLYQGFGGSGEKGIFRDFGEGRSFIVRDLEKRAIYFQEYGEQAISLPRG